MNLSLDKREYIFLKSKIKNLGQIIDTQRIKPDSSRSSAIKNILASTNVSTLETSQGRGNYYDNFMPKMNVLRAPLYKLFEKDSDGTGEPNVKLFWENKKNFNVRLESDALQFKEG